MKHQDEPSDFSNFIRNATTEEKEEVFKRVMQGAAEDQAKILEQARELEKQQQVREKEEQRLQKKRQDRLRAEEAFTKVADQCKDTFVQLEQYDKGEIELKPTNILKNPYENG